MAAQTQRRILVAGAALIDRTGWLHNRAAPGCSNPGKFDETPGGTALNVASVLACLGQDAELITKIGADASGQMLLDQLQARGVRTLPDYADHKDASTGTYTSIIEPDGSLFIAISDAGLYQQFDVAPYQEVLNRLGAQDYLCVESNLPGSALQGLLAESQARHVGLTVSKAKAHKLRPALDQLDLLFTNQVEAFALFELSDSGDETEIVNALRNAMAGTSRLSAAVISNGPDTVLIVDRDHATSLPVHPAETVVDVTGAGDALVGATLSGLMTGKNLRNSVEFGIEAAHATIQFAGAYQSDLAERIQSSRPR